MNSVYRLLFLFGSLLWLQACSDIKKEPDAKAGNNAADKPLMLSIERVSDADPLLNFNAIPLGVSYTKVKDKLPAYPLKLEEEITGDTSLQQSIVPLSIFGRNGKLELNFKDKNIYSYYYSIPTQSPVWADSVYNSLAALYNTRYGKGSEEIASEGDQLSKSYYWHSGNFDIAMTYSQMSSLLSWGVQQKQAMVP